MLHSLKDVHTSSVQVSALQTCRCPRLWLCGRVVLASHVRRRTVKEEEAKESLRACETRRRWRPGAGCSYTREALIKHS